MKKINRAIPMDHSWTFPTSQPRYLTSLSRLFPPPWRFIAAFSLPFALYLLTLAPTIYNLDSAELTVAAATGGIVRATGYPLYLLLGRLWSLLPVGDVGYRLNLFSAFSGALTVALAERLLNRLKVGPWASLGALGLLATAPYFWGLSLIAEVYTLHTALMAALILAVLRWGRQPSHLRLAFFGFLLGLSFSHHGATVLLVPGLLVYLLLTSWRSCLAPKPIIITGFALLAGLGLYLYLPLRYFHQPAFNYAGQFDANLVFNPLDLGNPAGLWWLVTARPFAGQMFAYTWPEFWWEATRFALNLWRAFFAIGIGPGLLGLVVLAKANWRVSALLALMFAGHTLFYIDYRVVDKDTMFLPAYLVWSLWLGVGLQALLNWLGNPTTGSTQSQGVRLIQVGVLVAVLLATIWNFRLVDLSKDRSTRQRGEAILQVVEPDALVFGWWDTVPVIEYLQLVEGKRPDVKAINRFLISPQDLHLAMIKQARYRPVYIDSLPGGLPANLKAKPAGPLYRLLATSVHERNINQRFIR